MKIDTTGISMIRRFLLNIDNPKRKGRIIDRNKDRYINKIVNEYPQSCTYVNTSYLVGKA
jgi:hypothetical protein